MGPGVPPRYTVTDEGDFLRVRWADGVIMDADAVRSRISAVEALSTHGVRPLLVHIGLVDRITPEAKQLLVEDDSSTKVAILSDDEVGRVLTAFNHRSAMPSRHFSSEDEAITWLTDNHTDDSADDRTFAADTGDR